MIKVNSNEYKYIHKWLFQTYGKASCCENPKCSGKSQVFNWALIHRFDYDYCREYFKQLCLSCHRAYDMTDELKNKVGLANKGKASPMLGKRHSPESINKIKAARKKQVFVFILNPTQCRLAIRFEEDFTQKEIASFFDVSRWSIQKNKRNYVKH